MIRKCSPADLEQMHVVINDAAQAYKGAIPDDRWQEPYMPREELAAEIEDGVVFWALEEDGRLVGVMGVQDKGEVTLIRHAYVRTSRRGGGIGTRLLRHLEGLTAKPILIGTWLAAGWAIRFYERNGYAAQSREDSERLLRRYWKIPERQIETSVVLAIQKRTMEKRLQSIPELLERFPRANLLPKPSPIHRLPRLSAEVGCDIHILRDDLTGFALGGNKTRKLDFLVGDAVARQADTLVTMKATSFSRNAAPAARIWGLDLHVVVAGDESEQNPWSQAFFKQYRTRLHYVAGGGDKALTDTCSQIVDSLRSRGKAVYELHPGGSDCIGSLGYVAAFQEILDHSRDSGVHFSDILLSLGSAGTQVGLIVGQCASGSDTRVIGIAASQTAELQSQRIRELASATARMLGIQMDEEKIQVDDTFIGPGYAIASEEGQQAVEMFASREGILLDPVYTGKAAAALLYYAKEGMFQGGHVLFVHTGGNSGLYY
jgi:1-aminocyclopropane-1-carboxylate deaminase/D-cysteine desulfhydrase-like pyridoxal-dependent ACC family enzyme/GNAT superfamily N-acetyltransferase